LEEEITPYLCILFNGKLVCLLTISVLD